MFYALRVSSQVRKAMAACGLSDQVRHDYALFVTQMVMSKVKHREIELIDRASASGMSVARAAYEVLTFEYQVAERVAKSPDAAGLSDHPRMFDNVLFAIATTAALLAQGNDLPVERLLADFPLLAKAMPNVG
jgi:hypothetical protein